MKLSVVVPCYNEKASIKEFYEQLTKMLKKEKITYEIIFIDDGSYDDTYLEIEEIITSDKNVRGIRFSRNFGKESAMLAGLEHATGEYVAIMDADLQHTPDMLVQMYKKLVDNTEYDVVCAYKANRRNEGSLKRTLTSIFYKVNNRISDVKLLPGASDFRVFTSSVKDAIISLPEKTRFLKGIFSWVGFNTIYVPYTPEKRLHGTSKWSIIKLIKYSLGGIVSFSTKPIKFIFFLGILVFMVGLINFLLMGNLANRTIILLISIIMLSLGIMSLYISRIYSNILGRPNYIIKKKSGFNNKTTK